MVYQVNVVATFTSPAPIAVVSRSPAAPVIASEIPVPKRMPFEPPLTSTVPPGGIGTVNTGTDVPTVGATVRLKNFKKRAAADVLLTTALHSIPEVLLMSRAFVVARLFVKVVVGVTGRTVPPVTVTAVVPPMICTGCG